MIEFNFSKVKEYTVRKLFYPFLVFITIFVVYLNFIYEARFSANESYRKFMYPIDMVTIVILGFFAIYFLSNEFR